MQRGAARPVDYPRAGNLAPETNTMRTFLLATTAVVALGSAAWAASDNAANNTDQGNMKVRQELTQMLQKSGYTDIRVAPTSFMVKAKDQAGNAVVMSISPDRFAEMTAVNDTTQGGKDRTSLKTVAP